MKTAIPILVGTKYDKYTALPQEEQEDIVNQVRPEIRKCHHVVLLTWFCITVVFIFQARRYAKVMKAPIVFISSAQSINVQKVFKIILSKVFDLKLAIEPITNVGEPIVEF